MLSNARELRTKGKPAQKRGAEHDTRNDFSNDLRLAQSNKELPKHLSQSHEKQQEQKDGSQIGIWQRPQSPAAYDGRVLRRVAVYCTPSRPMFLGPLKCAESP